MGLEGRKSWATSHDTPDLILGKRLSQRPVQHMGHGMVGCHFAAVLIVHLKCVFRKIQVFWEAYGCNDDSWRNILITLLDVAGCITEICQVHSTLPFALSQEASQKTSSPTFKETGIGPTCKTYPAKTWLYHRIMPFQNCMEAACAACGQCKSVNLLEGWNRGQKTETEVRPAQPSPSSTPLHLPRDSMAFSNSSTSFQIRLASRQAQEPFFDMFHPCNLATLLRRPRSPTWPPASA